jgi:mRNA-degrading endonuclease YafQ of YafQ-DinJ toxin-antitoxin module
LRAVLRRHPELRTRLAQFVRVLEADPWAPHLRLHPLRGKLKDCHAASVTYEYRALLTLRIDAQTIVLLNIGTHDEVYRTR